MTVDEARQVLAEGRKLRVVVGTSWDDPKLVVWLDDGMVTSEAVGGWSAGAVEPVCALDSDFLRTFLNGKHSIEVVPDDAEGWERKGSIPCARETVREFFVEYDRRIVNAPDPEYAARLQSYEPWLRAKADEDAVWFAREVMDSLAQALAQQTDERLRQMRGQE
jgi:hypothetical protein